MAAGFTPVSALCIRQDCAFEQVQLTAEQVGNLNVIPLRVPYIDGNQRRYLSIYAGVEMDEGHAINKMGTRMLNLLSRFRIQATGDVYFFDDKEPVVDFAFMERVIQASGPPATLQSTS